jgi:hypothetical protein
VAAVPTLVEVAARLGVPADDPDLGLMYAAAVEAQAAYCLIEVYTDGLAEALYRRAANLWASRTHTLGILDTGLDVGVGYVPRYDPVLDALEGPWRIVAVA